MRQFARPVFSSGVPHAGPVTRWLCGLLLAVSLVGSITQRKFGFGVSDLTFRVDAVVLGHELWRLVTYAFVKTTPLNLILSTVILWMFGRWYEGAWGSRDFLRFFFASILGAALLAIPLGYLVNLVMPFQDLGLAEGPDAAVDAMMMAMVLNNPDSNILFGFVLPVRARTLIYIFLAMDVVTGILTGASTLSITVGGMLMGYFLVTGHWRPSFWLNAVRLRRLRRRRDALYVVPPKNKHTLN